VVVESLDDDDELSVDDDDGLSVDGVGDLASELGVISTTVPFGDTVCGGIATGLAVGTVVPVVIGGDVGAAAGGGVVVEDGTVVVVVVGTPVGATVVVETGWVSSCEAVRSTLAARGTGCAALVPNPIDITAATSTANPTTPAYSRSDETAPPCRVMRIMNDPLPWAVRRR